MPEIPIRIIQDPMAAKGCIALLHNPTNQTLSFRLWDLSLDFNYDPKCLKRERQQRFITEYVLDDSLNDLIGELFQKPTVLGKKRTELGGNLSLNVGNRTPLTRYIMIGGIKGIIRIDTLNTRTSTLPHMEIEVDAEPVGSSQDRLTQEKYLERDERKYSMYTAILHEDYHTVKEYFLQQNIANTQDIVDRYFPHAVQAKSAPEFFDIFFSSGIDPNMIYHQKESIAMFLGWGLELLRNKEFVDVLIKHNFDFNYQTSKAKDGGLELLVEVIFPDLPIVRALTASSPFSEFGKWHAACRYMIDVGGADIDAKVFDYKDLPDNVMSHPEKHKEFCRENGMTILAYASCQGFGSRHIVQQLLELGADPDIKYKGKYIWDFCESETTRQILLSAHSEKAKGVVPKHRYRTIFEHEGLYMFVKEGPVKYVEAALSVGANPDVLFQKQGGEKAHLWEIFTDEAKRKVLVEASENIQRRRLRMIKARLDATVQPSRRYIPGNDSFSGNPKYTKLANDFMGVLSRETGKSPTTVGKRGAPSVDIRDIDEEVQNEIRRLDLQDRKNEAEYAHRLSVTGTRHKSQKLRKIERELDGLHRSEAVQRDLQKELKEARDEMRAHRY